MTKTDRQVYTYVKKVLMVFQNNTHATQALVALKGKYDLSNTQTQYVNETINNLKGGFYE